MTCSTSVSPTRKTASLARNGCGATAPLGPIFQYDGVILPTPSAAAVKLTTSPVAPALKSAQNELPDWQDDGCTYQLDAAGPIEAPGGRHCESVTPVSASKISSKAG